MIPFSPPHITDDVISEVVDALESGWITTGPKVRLLENKLANFIGVNNVLCVNSWTSGTIMVLRWLGLKDGDEVILPAYTYSATALAVIHAGGTPVMVDVDDNFNIDIDKVEKAITPRTKAIMPVDFAGLPCDYDGLNKIVHKSATRKMFEPTSAVQEKLGRILLISDAAHSLGATYKDEKTGNHSDITVFSLHAVKNVTTAEGGAIVINMPPPFDNDALYTELRMMTLNCQTKDAFNKSKAGGWRYDIVGLGMKINMADVNAAIGLAQMKEYDELLIRREAIFQKYADGFKNHNCFKVPSMQDESRKSSCHIFPIRIKNISEEDRDKIIDEITEMKIAVNVHFIPLPMLSYFKNLGYQIGDYPKSFDNYAAEISLPIYPQLKDNEIEYIIDSVIKSYEKVTERFVIK